MAGHILREQSSGHWGGGLELSPNATVSFLAPTGWPGSLWTCTGCVVSLFSRLSCATSECSAAASCCLDGVPPVAGGVHPAWRQRQGLIRHEPSGRVQCRHRVAATGARANYAMGGYTGCVGDVNAVYLSEL
uniref:Uncharacterized protein n=1 Tax=Zea mays TaxID=4577 RepID=A0A804LGH1_MAIZE